MTRLSSPIVRVENTTICRVQNPGFFVIRCVCVKFARPGNDKIHTGKKMNRVLITGRPNVGKSSLFNRLVRRRQALVVDQPGVTRDILRQKASWWGTDFEVWDSGGLWAGKSRWGKLIDQKVSEALNLVDLALFVVDGRAGLTEEDKKTFRLIKKSGKLFLTLVNKLDSEQKSDLLLNDFYSLGCDLVPCAFEKNRGVPEVVEWILANTGTKNRAGEDTALERPPRSPRIILAGKVNTGKSTLYNVLLGEQRALTSPVPGTTVDVVEEHFHYAEKSYILLDTAGRSKALRGKKVPSLAELKTRQSFETADIILLLVDGRAGVGRQDARLLNFCAEKHKAVIMVVNKWDLNRTVIKSEYRKSVQEQFRFYPDLPVVFISALHNQGVGRLMKKVEEMYQKICVRVSTPELNRFFMKVIRKAPSPVYGTQNVKFYYLTQTHRTPPSFIAFANYPQGVRDSYRRFLIRQIQNEWGLRGVPIRISVLPRPQKK